MQRPRDIRRGCLGPMRGVVPLLMLAWGAALPAQDKSSRAQLPVEPAAERRLDQAREFIAAAQWRDAFDALRPLFGSEGDGLVRAETGRFLPGRIVAQVLLSRLPPQGLSELRRRGETAARERYEQGLRERDEGALAGVVNQDFASSVSDDALFWLGELAFERGDLFAARGYWRKLVPPAAIVPFEVARAEDPPAEGAQAKGVAAPLLLNHPDPDVDLVEVRARLILCSILLGEFPRAARELAAFGELHGNAKGVYGGAEVVWRDRLREELADALAARTLADRAFAPTFGGSAARTGVATATPDIATKIWETPWSRVFRLPGQPFASPPDRRPVPCHFPVIDGANVFACDDSSIYGWKLATGEPLWEGEKDRPPHEIFHLSLDDQGHLLDRNDGAIGVPHHTVTVHRGRLYARLGAVDRVHHATGLPPGRLVCLDVGEREGQPLWVVSMDDIPEAEGNWMFEGTPAVTDGGVFVAMSRPGPRPACGLAALHPETGRVRWFRVTCEGTPRWRSEEDRGRIDDGRRHVMAELSHSLVTVAEGRVFHTTHLGAVVALDERTGRWEWGATYPQGLVPDVIGFAARRFHGPSPALCSGGILVVAPHDSTHLLGLDSETGLVRWSRPHGQRISTLLGIADGCVYASGDEILALDVATGQRVWGHGSRDDQLEGWGRGVLSGDEILWPLRDAIRVIDRKTGRFVRAPIDLAERGVVGGGHLAVGSGVVLVSSPFGMTALGERGAIRPEKPLETRVGPERKSPPRVENAIAAREPSDGGKPVARAVADTQGKPSRWWRVAWEREFDRDCRWTVVEKDAEITTGVGTTGVGTRGSARDGEPAALVCEMARGVTALDPRSGNDLWSRSLPGRVSRVAFDEGRLRVDTSLVRAWLDTSSGTVLEIGGWRALGLKNEGPGERTLVNDANRGATPFALAAREAGADRRSIPSKTWSYGPRGVLRELSTPRALEWRRRDGSPVGRIPLGPDDEITQAALLDDDLAGIVTRQHRCALWRAGDRNREWYEGAMSRAHALPVWIEVPLGERSSGGKTDDPHLIKDGLTLARVDRRTGRDRWVVDLGPGIVERVEECVRRVEDVVVVLGRHDLRAIDAETGSVRWRQPLEGGSREWRWEGVSTAAETYTLRRGFPEGVEFLRVDAVDGLPVQRIVLPYRDSALVWHEWPDRACVTGPRMAMSWVAR